MHILYLYSDNFPQTSLETMLKGKKDIRDIFAINSKESLLQHSKRKEFLVILSKLYNENVELLGLARGKIFFEKSLTHS